VESAHELDLFTEIYRTLDAVDEWNDCEFAQLLKQEERIVVHSQKLGIVAVWIFYSGSLSIIHIQSRFYLEDPDRCTEVFATEWFLRAVEFMKEVSSIANPIAASCEEEYSLFSLDDLLPWEYLISFGYVFLRADGTAYIEHQLPLPDYAEELGQGLLFHCTERPADFKPTLYMDSVRRHKEKFSPATE
jgi:hypothetical protein